MSGVSGILVLEPSDVAVSSMPISSNAATAQLFLQRLLNCSCSECAIVPAATAQLLLQRLLNCLCHILNCGLGVDGILVLELCDVVVVFNALFPTAVCGVDGILVLGLCDIVVVFGAVSPTADCGVGGILVLGLCDVAVVV